MRSTTRARSAARVGAPTGRLFAFAACLLSAIALAAASATAQVRRDLLAEFASAQHPRQVGRLDLGSALAEPQLLDGWAARSSRNGTSRWGLGDSSAVSLFFAEPRDFTLIARGRWFKVDADLPPTVGLSVNGGPARSPDASDASEFRWSIPDDAIVRGHNEFRLHYSAHWVPRQHRSDSKDRRPLAIAWKSLELRGVAETPLPRVVPANGKSPAALVLPAGAQLDIFLWLSARDPNAATEPAFLEFETLESIGAGASRLLVELQADGAPGVRRLEHAAGGGAGRLALPLPAVGGALRLSLRAASSAGSADGVRIVAPVLVGAAFEAEVREQPASARRSSSTPRPNVVLYVVDTLRADHLGTYGYSKPVSAQLDAWARTGIVFENAYANSSWTRPSTASILTGLDPFAHRVISADDALAAEAETLAERLSTAGYQTAAWVTNPNVAADFGFQQGFDDYEFLAEDLADPAIFASADDLNRAATAWFEARDDTRPFFLYLHATDPHSPYVPPPETRERFAGHVTDASIGQRGFVKQLGELPGEPDSELVSNLTALYDAEVAAVDAAFAELLDLLRGRGVLANTLVVFTSDHGEEFFDHHWWGHGKTLYEEQLRVPLIVTLPEGASAPARVKRRVTQVDILPLVLSVLGLEVPGGIQGDARGLVEANDRGSDDRPAFALFERGNRSAQSVIDHGMKLIRYGDYAHPLGARPVTQLYDLARDPRERNNLARSRPVMTGYLQTLLRRADQRVPRLTPERAEVDLSIENRLRALGYIQ